MKWTSWLTVAALIAIGGFVIASSLRTGAVRCEVCMSFEGREACRAVDADEEGDAHHGAISNACAQLTSGVTQTMACERTPPIKAACSAR
jgi:hypothetical protein